ncbi:MULTISPECIES: PTS sugar transporter subunit IIA [Lacticaseibacillus]|uniref:PTS sugar transporter subunit IIA n=2 Tax=Lacticaseibacillus TaxID=2759736 RepID=A0AAN1F0U0_LACCA|nr:MULTISPECIES: PTS sugar transporter subunit IIA [Lacticaseibacillus]ARY92689.1 PTS sugar transporter subunit IIA [Lacticaseibacillus casei]KAB1969470.1 PTS sugar transporter subunit IIA [Lacticaseibacillus casei]WLV80590.1 PTS sugar transporter subunit IIA [Lacticaseibacillus sp. NCIMB 15473]WNX24550.1 PTS sugar transporter subunit IIA [Lacticaseibacillus casei]WNX27322.1 PTS sugar transporter subunit IIA [Lacticaseibacillus casei]
MEETRINHFFSDQVITFDEVFSDRNAVLKAVASRLTAVGAVRPTFGDAIIAREQTYPTGLQLNDGVGVAIPHTDADQVLHDQIGFIALKTPVTFRQMASATEVVSVNYLFVLALKTAHQQLDMLQKLMGLFADDKAMAEFQQITTVAAFIKFMTERGIG